MDVLVIEKEWAEKIKHFHLRTARHNQLVRNNMLDLFTLGLVDKYALDQEVLFLELREHDATKFKDPQYKAYIEISWSYYQQLDLGKAYPLDQVFQSNATIHHIISEKHHPEYWDPLFLKHGNKFNTTNRDGLPDTPTDASLMPLTWVAVMVCDWMAISQERNTSIYAWADKTVDKRWLFTPEQKEVLFATIDHLVLKEKMYG